MGSRGVQGPCSALFLLLLLLLLPPPLFRAGSFQHPRPGWRMFHHLGVGSRRGHHRRGPNARHHWRQGQAQQACKNKLDLYLIVDKSGSVNNNWADLYIFVEDIVKQFQNQETRISLITYSTEGDIVLPLTSDPVKIKQGLEILEKVVPEGHTFMQEGFKKAILQIERSKSTTEKIPSTIIAMTDGTMEPEAFTQSLEQANKARSLEATVYSVGVADYDKSQITQIADSEAHTFTVDTGFKALRSIVDQMSSKMCTEVKYVEPSSVCIGESYEVVVHGSGFLNTQGQDQVICRFQMSESDFIDEKPIRMDETSITCPGPKITNPGKKVSVKVSLDNGGKFYSAEKDSFTTTDCVSNGVGQTPTGNPSCAARAALSDQGMSRAFWAEPLSRARGGACRSLGTSPAPAPLWPLEVGLPGAKGVRAAGREEATQASPAADICLIRWTIGDVPLPQNFENWYWLIPALLLPLLLWFLCRLCFRKKKDQPVQTPEQPPPPPPVTVCPTVIVCCHGCHRGCRMCGRLEDNLGTMCGLAQPSYNEMPPMWCPHRVQGRCFNFQCLPCSPNICPSASQACRPLPCSPRRYQLPASCLRPSPTMLPMLCHSSQAYRKPCLSLPPSQPGL
nr:anthrax toxin receptor-like [Microcebus murinus]